MDILDTIKARRSIRKFTSEAVSEEIVDSILEAGRWAPSGLNNQPWRFAVVSNPHLIEQLADLTRYEKIVKGAGVLIAVFLDNASGYHRTKDVQAIGACLQNMLLQTHSLGLGCVWLGEIIKSNEQVKALLGLGGDLELMAVLAIGRPAERPGKVQRRSLKDLVIFRG